MDRLVAIKDVGDFRVGDVMPYTDPIDINILTTLGVAKLERPAPEDPPPSDPDDDDEEDDDDTMIVGTHSDHVVIFSESPNPMDEPTYPVDEPSDSPAEPAEPVDTPTNELLLKQWDEQEDEIIARRRGMRPERGTHPKHPEEYRTRVMNPERLHNKRRRQNRTPK